MRAGLLDILRCPFCGARLTPIEGPSLVRHADEIVSGVLSCECCAYPIVDGIAVVVADRRVETAMHQLEAGRGDEALLTLLEVDERRADDFRRFLAVGERGTYREAVDVLCPDGEGTYFFYRLSDPTFLVGSSVVRAVGGNVAARAGRALDLCGGSGHLSRTLGEIPFAGERVLADAYYWKLWLARRYVAPRSDAVCCDANSPLPFARGTFSFVACSDALHYIWCKRLVADEMMRLASDAGTVLVTHMHNALCENPTAGNPLTPDGYRNLLSEMNARLFADTELLTSVIEGRPLPLAAEPSAEVLAVEPSLTMMASRDMRAFRHYEVALPAPAGRAWVINPLYRIEPHHGNTRLVLTFPSEQYEEEFGACKRYLPEEVTLDGQWTRVVSPGASSSEITRLVEHRVLIDAPLNYCS